MNEAKNINKTFTPDVYKVKDFLEKNCVGKSNIKSYSEIVNLLDMKIEHCRFKKIIQILRRNFDRYICSTSKGYYLPTTEEEASRYSINQTITHLKTCLAQGVDPRVFYDVLNNSPRNNVIDGQLKLKVTPYAKEEVTRYTKTEG